MTFSNINRPTFFNFWKTRRYVLTLLASLGFLNAYALRTNLSVAIVDMTQYKNVTLENGTTILKQEFDWDSKVQGVVLGSFFYGYITTQLFGGYIASRFGGAKVCGFGLAVTALLTVVTPWVAKLGVTWLIAIRIIEGIFEGVMYPAWHAAISKWSPPLERTRMVTIAWSGTYLGTVISMPLSSVLATSLGWESIFYFFGTAGLLWYILWIFIARDSPSEDPRISKEELKYITESINTSKLSKHKVLNIPWKHYLTSMCVWAIVVAQIAEFWGFYTLLTNLPKFMKYVLNFDLNKAGLLSAMPYLFLSVMMQIAGLLGDWIVTKKKLSITWARKVYILVGYTSQSICLLLAAYWMSPVVTSLCLILALGLGAFGISAFGVNSLDIAPKYGGITFGYCNTFGTIPGIVSPTITGFIVSDETSVSQWRVVFYITAGIYLFGALFYLCFASANVQPWVKDSQSENDEDGKKDKTFLD